VTAPPPALLLVDGDRARARALAVQLERDGYEVAVACTARHARALAGMRPPAVALLGALEEPRAALCLLEEIRRAEGEPWERCTPALVIERSGRELDVLRAFEAGADDVLGPHAGYLELRARLAAVRRRASGERPQAAVIAVESLSIDTRARVARLAGRQLALRHLEFELLLHLAREPRRVFARAELLSAVWGYRAPARTRTLDSHASRVRRKLRAHDPRPWVVGVWGVGYRLI
jgi:DNA-binding response OmpR family regulator